MHDPEIHPTAVVSREARLGAGTRVDAFSIVGAHVEVGENSTIGSHCVLGEGNDERLMIGANATIRSHTIIYGGSTLGSELETGHHVTMREGLQVGRNLRVGTACDLQGHAQIGHFVRMHSGVQVNHETTIEDFVWLFPYVLLTNDPHPPSDDATVGPYIERCAAVCARSLILPGIRVGAGCLVAAGSTVTRDVAAGRVVMGSPARDVGSVDGVPWRDDRPGTPYPWWNHFRRGYPAEVRWEADGPRYEHEDG